MSLSFFKSLLGATIVLATIAATLCGGCTSVRRDAREQAWLLERRDEYRQRNQADARRMFEQYLAQVKSDVDEHAAGRRTQPPVIDVLIISGGGDWGAFGAGFLKGWSTVPATDPLARPEFDVVTGVSTGALIAPFAFIGDEESTERVVQLYRNPRKDWVKQRWPLYFLPNNISFAEVPGLERALRKTVTPEMVARIAAASDDGRMLFVNATNLDDASVRPFNLVDEAQVAIETGKLDRVHNVLLASAGIPGAFPYREIDGEMFVDGGVTSNIAYGGGIREEDSIPSIWHALYPDTKMPKLRFWVIFNNQLQAPPTVVAARWPSIVTRSLELATRSATLTAMKHLHAQAELWRVKRTADVEVRIVAIPNDWTAPVPGVFIKETMNNLADLGEKMGADPGSWRTDSP